MPASEPVGNLQHETYMPWTQPVYSHVPRRSCWVASMAQSGGLALKMGDRGVEQAAVLQPLAALCRPAMLPSWGLRWWGAAGRWPSPRAWRCAGIITWWATRSGGLASRGVIADRSALQCCNRSRYPAGRQPQPLPGGARSDPVGVLLDHGQVPGRDGRQGHHLVGDPLRRPGPLGRVIVGRSALQCCNRSRYPAGRQPQPLPGGARSDPVGVLLDHGQVPGRDGRQGHHLVDDPLRRPGPLGRVIVGRSELQCCNRSRHPAGQQPQPLLGGARSDPVGVLLGHGQVHGRDSRQGHHLVGNRVRWPGPQERVIEGRSKLQCSNCWGTPLASSPSLSLVVRDQIRWACCWTMAKSPGGTADRGHHLVGDPVLRPGPEGRVIVGRSTLQCCNRSRHPAGQQPQHFPGGARSDPVGVLLGHGVGHVPGLDGRQSPSPGGRRARRPGSQVRAAVLQPLEVPRWPAAPAFPW